MEYLLSMLPAMTLSRRAINHVYVKETEKSNVVNGFPWTGNSCNGIRPLLFLLSELFILTNIRVA